MNNSSSSNDDDHKRPARRKTTKKRKQSDAALSLQQHDDDEIGAGSLLDGLSPQDLAQKLLAWLPQDATIKHKDAQKLLKSVDLVRAELQHRANRMTVDSIESGEKADVLLSGMSLPSILMQNILEYVPRPQAVTSASLVSKSWLAIVRAPEFWKALDHSAGLLEESHTILNMTDLLKLLNRPQFASLRTLAPPNKVQNRKKALEQVAKACPLLEEIDLGLGTWTHMKIDDAALRSLPPLFPHLKAVRFNTYRVSSAGLTDWCRAMGTNLVDLAVYESYDKQLLSNEVLASIGKSCPKLEHFYINFDYKTCGDGVGKGVIDLLENCSNVKSLRLFNCNNMDQEVYEYIINSNTIVLERLIVVCDDGVIAPFRAGLQAKVRSFETFTGKEENNRIQSLYHDGGPRSSFYW